MKDELAESATAWWDSIQSINIKDISGLYFKVAIMKKELANQVYSTMSIQDQNRINETIKTLKAKSGKAAINPKHFLESITMRSPLLVVDRYDALGRLFGFLTFGKYKRYAWINPLQIATMAIIHNAKDRCCEDIHISAHVVKKSQVTRDYMIDIEKNYFQYTHAGK